MYIDSAANISGKIGEGIYNRKIEQVLSQNPLKAGINFKVKIAKGTNIIRVVFQCKEENLDSGIKAAGQLPGLVAGDYEGMVNYGKVALDGQIFSKQSNIKKFEAQGKLLKAALKDIKCRIEELNNETDNIKKNTGELLKQRDLLLKEGKAETEISLLLYSTTIQQNISYMNQITNQFYEFREKEKQVLREIGRAERAIDIAKREIDSLLANKELISNIKIIQAPEVSLHPVKPKKKQIVLLTSVVALFMFIFLAFFIEYIKNATRSTK